MSAEFLSWLPQSFEGWLLLGVQVVLLQLAIFLCLWVFLSQEKRLDDRRRSLGLIDEPGPSTVRSIAPNLAEQTSWDKFTTIFLPRNDKALALNSQRLRLAGYRSSTAMASYFTVRTTAMLLLPLLVMLLPAVVPGMTFRELTPYAGFAFVVGMIIPSYCLDKMIERRQRLLQNAVPDLLDLLVICTEAGLSLNAALVRVTRELADIHPEFAEEMAIVLGEIRAGLDRERALRSLIDRTGLEDIKALVVLLIQSMRMGTSVAETLRVYSEEFREQRMQKAEEEAAKLATKMIFPMVVCFMPAFFVAAIGPAMISLVKNF